MSESTTGPTAILTALEVTMGAPLDDEVAAEPNIKW